MQSSVIFQFSSQTDVREWRVVDDVVMGGRSSGTISLNADGIGVYAGEISLENNGGFSSLRHQTKKVVVSDYNKIVVRIKGDGKKYQFRIKSDRDTYYSYIHYFETNGEWQEIEMQFADFYPSFRGRKLAQPNFSGDFIEEITFLIGNKKEEKFKLLIDRIEVK